ncbi:hypothetical protein F6Q07_19695 [Pectobacterium parmentieri]|uniref:hypothetical protein n=1 Tax=Pectobacterium parmentieri TaxID=1905730 RepID=UPI000EB518DD|nr:hypothetical protein [Pectobacterium parmentieri]AYH02225.1 hypothetical protein C5E26_15440 [Pectobacterium parmentieri]AYH28490.1 hypothetical protein C5E20_15840 [Pectobacterium parmentieri]AYH32799.1 hypothetical protein C5E19_14880 [Pectobacterium parmentieri]MBI0520328.1 hypothetical protein [Pectobacterium parmentieri]
MSTSSRSPLFIHHLRHKGRLGWLLALCWLFLNAQLAIAGHQCDMTLSQASPAIQHQAHLQQGDAQPLSPHAHHATKASYATDQQTPLCEKHCVPDSVKQDNGSLALLALPVSSELVLADHSVTLNQSCDTWLSPPAAGPPAEIRFCRFRE